MEGIAGEWTAGQGAADGRGGHAWAPSLARSHRGEGRRTRAGQAGGHRCGTWAACSRYWPPPKTQEVASGCWRWPYRKDASPRATSTATTTKASTYSKAGPPSTGGRRTLRAAAARSG